MIRKALKKIFSVAFLKQCFLVYNKIKICTVDKIVYSEFKIPKADFRIYREDFPFRINQINITSLHNRAEYPFMKDWIDWIQSEFLLEFNRACWIEPECGWAIISPNQLVYESLAFSRAIHQRKPSLTKFFLRKETRVVDKAISLRDGGEENYFHFYNDVLSKIFYLRDQGIDVHQYSVIVSKKLSDKPYFKYYLDHSDFLKSLTWIVQNSEYIHCKLVIFCKPMTHSLKLWREFIAPGVAVAKDGRRIFLTRDKNRMRFIENMDEIEAICRRYDVEVVDTDAMPFGRQIELFSQALFIAGIHGAGLTNMVYRNADCRILEIFPPPDLGYLPYHYVLLAGMKKFSYRAIIGEPGKVQYSGGFYLKGIQFEKELREFL